MGRLHRAARSRVHLPLPSAQGPPKHLHRIAAALTIDVHTEPLVSASGHDVFFNRGVASSQAYEREFGTTPIAELDPQVRERALAWLSRDLGTALLRFIDDVPAGEQLLGCFYEFHYHQRSTGSRRPSTAASTSGSSSTRR